MYEGDWQSRQKGATLLIDLQFFSHNRNIPTLNGVKR